MTAMTALTAMTSLTTMSPHDSHDIITECWAQLSIQLALCCSSGHYVGHSLQIFRALRVSISSRILTDIPSQLVQTIAEQRDKSRDSSPSSSSLSRPWWTPISPYHNRSSSYNMSPQH